MRHVQEEFFFAIFLASIFLFLFAFVTFYEIDFGFCLLLGCQVFKEILTDEWNNNEGFM